MLRKILLNLFLEKQSQVINGKKGCFMSLCLKSVQRFNFQKSLKNKSKQTKMSKVFCGNFLQLIPKSKTQNLKYRKWQDNLLTLITLETTELDGLFNLSLEVYSYCKKNLSKSISSGLAKSTTKFSHHFQVIMLTNSYYKMIQGQPVTLQCLFHNLK